MPAAIVTASIGAPARRAFGTIRVAPNWRFHMKRSKNIVLNPAVRPGSRRRSRPLRFSAKTSSEYWPPPAISAQWPAFAAAATISGATVVGVMPSRMIGDLPVRRVKAVSAWTEPSGRVMRRGAKDSHEAGACGAEPGASRAVRARRVEASRTRAPDHRGGAEVEEDARAGLECAGDLRGPVGGFDEDPGREAVRAIGVDLAS